MSICARTEQFLGGLVAVSLVSGLPPVLHGSVGFTKWQVVLGVGSEKRILLKIDAQAAVE